MPMSQPPEPTPIQYAAADLAHADLQRTEARERLITHVREAAGLGVPVAELARQAGVRRLTIYAWLEGSR